MGERWVEAAFAAHEWQTNIRNIYRWAREGRIDCRDNLAGRREVRVDNVELVEGRPRRTERSASHEGATGSNHGATDETALALTPDQLVDRVAARLAEEVVVVLEDHTARQRALTEDLGQQFTDHTMRQQESLEYLAERVAALERELAATRLELTTASSSRRSWWRFWRRREPVL